MIAYENTIENYAELICFYIQYLLTLRECITIPAIVIATAILIRITTIINITIATRSAINLNIDRCVWMSKKVCRKISLQNLENP